MPGYLGTSPRFWLNLQARYDLGVDAVGDRLCRTPAPLTSVAAWLRLLVRRGGEQRLIVMLTGGTVKPTIDGRYQHWHSLRHLDPPDGFSHEK